MACPIDMAQALPLDQTPADADAWGFTPADGAVIHETPPSFVWRPQILAARYTVEAARSSAFEPVDYRADDLAYTAHRPPRTFEPGRWHWRFRYETKEGESSPWSDTRTFTIERDSAALPLPEKEELLGRLPKSHPRLLVRPEEIAALRELAEGEFNTRYQRLIKHCDTLLADPPDTSEPPRYPEDMTYGSPEWRKIWWGNRERVEAVLQGAATLGFVWQLSGDRRYLEQAKHLLMHAAGWDASPDGSTSFTYNHEAGMPFARHFSRAYTFIHDELIESQRAVCQQVARQRGRQLFDDYLRAKQHLWIPYSSHANRAWHFLAELAIAFHGEVPEAEQWLWYAMNVYSNVYPVWSGPDGGWHEGMHYFHSYLARFLEWADVMHKAMGVSAFDKLFFSSAGYFPMYLMPPGTETGGFGDHAERMMPPRTEADGFGDQGKRIDGADESPDILAGTLATQTGNRHWRWYAEAFGGYQPSDNYVQLIRAGYPHVAPAPPTELPASRWFRGVGIAAMNTSLIDGTKNLQVLFKASPFGSQSHGYDAQNSLVVNYLGKPLLIRSGTRDRYGSDHHENWMWHTRSQNNITINGQSQTRCHADAIGQITAFYDDTHFAYVNGDATQAYGGIAERAERAILMVKPQLVLVFDRLAVHDPATFEYHLHAVNPMRVEGQHDVRITNSPAACRVNLLWPEGLSVTQTDRFAAPLMSNQTLVQHHLTASTTEPATSANFVTVIQPHHAEKTPTGQAVLSHDGGRFHVTVPLAGDRTLEVTLDSSPDVAEAICAQIHSAQGAAVARFDANQAADHGA